VGRFENGFPEKRENGFQSKLQVKGAYKGLQSASQKVKASAPTIIFLTFTQKNEVTQTQIEGSFSEYTTADNLGLIFGEDSFPTMGIGGIEILRCNKAQYSISKELQALVIIGEVMFKRVAAMGQRLIDQLQPGAG
jgi:hypothetical protein